MPPVMQSRRLPYGNTVSDSLFPKRDPNAAFSKAASCGQRLNFTAYPSQRQIDKAESAILF